MRSKSRVKLLFYLFQRNSPKRRFVRYTISVSTLVVVVVVYTSNTAATLYYFMIFFLFQEDKSCASETWFTYIIFNAQSSVSIIVILIICGPSPKKKRHRTGIEILACPSKIGRCTGKHNKIIIIHYTVVSGTFPHNNNWDSRRWLLNTIFSLLPSFRMTYIVCITVDGPPPPPGNYRLWAKTHFTETRRN